MCSPCPDSSEGRPQDVALGAVVWPTLNDNSTQKCRQDDRGDKQEGQHIVGDVGIGYRSVAGVPH